MKMEFPHHRRRHHHHEEEIQEIRGRTEYYPPPDTGPAPLPYRQNRDFGFDPSPLPPPNQPRYYQSEPEFPTPPRSHFQEGSNYDTYGRPPPLEAARVTHVSHYHHHHHHHHYHHRRNDDEEEGQETRGRTEYCPPPDTAPAPLPYLQNRDFGFVPSPLPPPNQPRFYQSEPEFPTLPRLHFQEGSNYDSYGRPPPLEAARVTHVSHYHHHHHHHYHHRRNDDEEGQETRGRTEYYPPPDTAPAPLPYLLNRDFGFDPSPLPPPNQPRFYQSEPEFPTPPRSHFQEGSNCDSYGRPPPLEAALVTHVSHYQGEPGGGAPHHYSLRPHLPSSLHQEEGGYRYSGGGVPAAAGLDLSDKPTFKVYCKAAPNFHLTIRDGEVLLATADPSDPYQHWYKDGKYSTRLKDEEELPCFALVNKATGQAIRHSVGASQPVQLIPYKPDILDVSVLWTESKDMGDGYTAVRMVNNIRLNMDAFHGDEKSGGVHDGTTIVLWGWNNGHNQLWKIIHRCKFPSQ